MINFLHKWIEQIAIAVILVSIFEMLLPNGNIKKYIKMILGLLVVFSIISPFVDSKALYNLNTNDIIGEYNLTQQESVNDKIEDSYIKELENDITKTVEEQGYNVKSCKIDARIYSGDKDAGIKSINIILLSKNKKEENNNNSDIETVNKVEIGVNIGDNEKTEENDITDKDIKTLKKFLSEHYEIDKKVININ